VTSYRLYKNTNAHMSTESSEAFLLGQDIAEILQLLDYETDFCSSKAEFRPIVNAFFFAFEGGGGAVSVQTQFSYFKAIAGWLVKMIGI